MIFLNIIVINVVLNNIRDEIIHNPLCLCLTWWVYMAGGTSNLVIWTWGTNAMLELVLQSSYVFQVQLTWIEDNYSFLYVHGSWQTRCNFC